MPPSPESMPPPPPEGAGGGGAAKATQNLSELRCKLKLHRDNSEKEMHSASYTRTLLSGLLAARLQHSLCLNYILGPALGHFSKHASECPAPARAAGGGGEA